MADFEKGWENKPIRDMSPKERKELVARNEKGRKDREREQKAWEDAHEEAVAKGSDAAFEKDFQDLFGASTAEVGKEVREAIKKNPNDKDFQEAAEIIKNAEKAAKGGWFSSGNRGKARRILRGGKKKIKKARKKGKGGWFS